MTEVILSFLIRLNEYINYWLVAIRPKDENSHSEKLRQKETYTFNFQSRVVFWTRPIREMLKVWNVPVNQKKHLLVILMMIIMMVIIQLIHKFQNETPDYFTDCFRSHLCFINTMRSRFDWLTPLFNSRCGILVFL